MEKSKFKNSKEAYLPVRDSMGVILLNQKNELLLMKADDPKTTSTSGHYNGPFWFSIGGAIEPGESVENAVLREIFEETGIEKKYITLGPIVWKGEFDLVLYGVLTRLKQRFMVAKTSLNKVTLANLTIQEKLVIKELHWFSLDDIKKTKELIYPMSLE